MGCFFLPMIKILYRVNFTPVHLFKSIILSLVCSVSCLYSPFTHLHRKTHAVSQFTIKILIKSPLVNGVDNYNHLRNEEMGRYCQNDLLRVISEISNKTKRKPYSCSLMFTLGYFHLHKQKRRNS